MKLLVTFLIKGLVVHFCPFNGQRYIHVGYHKTTTQCFLSKNLQHILRKTFLSDQKSISNRHRHTELFWCKINFVLIAGVSTLTLIQFVRMWAFNMPLISHQTSSVVNSICLVASRVYLKINFICDNIK